jgi:hypothetical protein
MKKYVLLAIALLALTGLNSCSKHNDSAPEPDYLEFTLSGNASSGTLTDAENKAAKTFISVTNKMTMDYAGALANQGKTDMVLRASNYNGNIPEKTRGLFVSSMQEGDYGGNSTLDDFTTKLSCKFAQLNNEFTFESITDLASLKAGFAKISADDFNESASLISGTGSNMISINSLAFKTAFGKVGIMRVSGYNPQKPFTYTIQVKMER